MGGREWIVNRLLSEPRLLCVRDRDSYGFTPLMYAAMAGHSTDVVRSLIADGYEGVLQMIGLWLLFSVIRDLSFG